ncbi:MAG: hypothetical protein ACKV2T_37510 [Kofleriaceae bacterium]
MTSEGKPRADDVGRAAAAHVKAWIGATPSKVTTIEAAGALSLLGSRSDAHDTSLAELLLRDHGYPFMVDVLVAMWSMATNSICTGVDHGPKVIGPSAGVSTAAPSGVPTIDEPSKPIRPHPARTTSTIGRTTPQLPTPAISRGSPEVSRRWLTRRVSVSIN